MKREGSALKSARKSCGAGRSNGTEHTNGNILRDETTCALPKVTALRVDCARVWLPQAVSRADVIARAVDELTLRLMRENPAFKLPPSCAFTEEVNP